MPNLPTIDDIQLTAVQRIRQETVQDLAPAKVLGLDGRVHQKLGRGAHRVVIEGLLVGETAIDDLHALQEKAREGDPVAFTADITTALEIEQMVIAHFAVDQKVGPGGQFAFRITLEESPPLPPPPAVSPFGGLDGFGNLGFDPGALGDVLGDVAGLAASAMGALDSALDAIDQLQGLAGLADLAAVGNPLSPLTDEVASLAALGPGVAALGSAAGQITGEGG